MNQPVGRFAPSPSGRMHLGNLFCSLLAWCSVRSQGGRMILRHEDLDKPRCPVEYARQLEEDLCWLGLDWDEGGLNPDGSLSAYCQSQRTSLYQQALEELERKGLLYPCTCTRAQLQVASAPHREDGTPIYPGNCRKGGIAPDRPAAQRIKVDGQTIRVQDGHMGEICQHLPTECGDFVLRRSDGVFAYQLAVVVDDALMGVNQVVRGADLLDSTPRQVFLYHQLGYEPPQFYHLPLLLAADGRRLAKRDKDVNLEQLKNCYNPEEIVGRLAYLAGQQSCIQPLRAAELAQKFDWSKVPQNDICIPDKMFKIG